MPVPDFQSLMLPLLDALADGNERLIREVTAVLADRFNLTEEARLEKLPSGQQSVISNRVAWAKTHLKSAGLIDNPTRGRIKLSDLGRSVLAQKPPAVNCPFLKQFPLNYRAAASGFLAEIDRMQLEVREYFWSLPHESVGVVDGVHVAGVS